MTTDEPPKPELLRLMRMLQDWLNDPHHRDDFAALTTVYDLFAQEFSHVALICGEMAAWCRLGADAARGEDVPWSIHPEADEDPADTTRWRKWRVS